jgi:hypothetical protein
VNFGSLIDAVINEGGFDATTGAVSRATVGSWINDAYRQLAAETNFLKALVSLGETVAGTSQYAIPENVLDVRRITVNGVPFIRVGVEQIFDARAFGGRVLGDAGGTFSPGYATTGARVIEVYPTPDTSGYAIDALATVAGVGMVSETDTPAIPEDFHPALKAKAIAMGLRLIYERHDDADRWELQFSNPGAGNGAVEKLKRRGNSQIGSGPTRVRLVG